MLAGRVGLGDVLGVGADSVAEQLRVHLRLALLRVLELLEHQNRARLAHHEPVAVGVERPTCRRGVMVAAGKRAHRRETGDPGARNRRVGAAAEHHLGTAEPDRIEAVPDRHLRRGAGGARRRKRPARAQLDRDPGGAHVRDDRQQRERIDAVGPPLDQRVAAVLERRQATHRGRDRGADPVGLLRDHDPRINLRLPRRRDGQLREAVHPPRLPVLDPPGRVELLRLAGRS